MRDDSDDSSDPANTKPINAQHRWFNLQNWWAFPYSKSATTTGTALSQAGRLSSMFAAIAIVIFLLIGFSIATRMTLLQYLSDTPTTIRVAFLGNSITFVNDLPRFMQALSLNRIQQNSCLHSSLNFGTLLTKGNGMYNKWQTPNALLYDPSTKRRKTDASTRPTLASSLSLFTMANNNNNISQRIYDFGACTFPQLLFGYDSHLTEYNSNGYYTDDGMNPCFQDSTYFQFMGLQQSRIDATAEFKEEQDNSYYWDFVVFNDQTIQPGVPRRRRRSLRSLKRVYAKLLNRTTAVPVFLSTYGYDKSLYDTSEEEEEDVQEDAADDDDAANNNNNNVASDNDSTDIYDILGDIPTFTSRVWYGYQLYASTLGAVLPETQQPIVVPSALAFLVIWEENYDAWLQLFYDDGFHPSPHGTFLLGCCLYASLYGRMPSRLTHRSKSNLANLFGRARRMHMDSMGDDRPFPTVSEAKYLASIAERIVLGGYLPGSLLSAETVAQMEADEASSGRW